MTTESQQYNGFIRNCGNAIPKHAGPEAKGSNPPLDLPCSGSVTQSAEILTTGKFHGKKRDRFSLNGAVGNLNGVNPNERAVKCSEV